MLTHRHTRDAAKPQGTGATRRADTNGMAPLRRSQIMEQRMAQKKEQAAAAVLQQGSLADEEV
jgi:hypothetical protein